MSSYRCPACGATHKEQVNACRLCGADMTGASMITPGATGAPRGSGKKKSGMARLLLVGVLGVLVIVGFALALGLTGEDELVGEIRREVPLLTPATETGWESFDDAEARLTISLPGERVERRVNFALVEGGLMDQWVANLGTETELSVAYGPVTPVATDIVAQRRMERWAETWAAQLGGKVDSATETSFRGQPAVDVQIRGLRHNDQWATARTLFVQRDEQLVVIQSLSVYPDHPQFQELANGVGFTS